MATQKMKPTKFVVSKDKNPKVELKPGQKFQVNTIQLVDVTLKKSKIGAARLCGGSSTCLAIVDISDNVER